MDISGLATTDDVVTVSDLDLSDQITVLTPPEEVIVSVSFVTEEEEEPEEDPANEKDNKDE